MIKAYRENSLKVDSDEMRRIRYAARDNQMYARMVTQACYLMYGMHS